MLSTFKLLIDQMACPRVVFCSQKYDATRLDRRGLNPSLKRQTALQNSRSESVLEAVLPSSVRKAERNAPKKVTYSYLMISVVFPTRQNVGENGIDSLSLKINCSLEPLRKIQ